MRESSLRHEAHDYAERIRERLTRRLQHMRAALDTTLFLGKTAKTYDTPYLSMLHGESKAVITYPGHKDVVLEFGSPMKREAAKAQDAKK